MEVMVSNMTCVGKKIYVKECFAFHQFRNFQKLFKILSYLYRQSSLRFNHWGIGKDSGKEKEKNDVGNNMFF